MKQRIRLTESDLHKVIKESVKKILNELAPQTYESAKEKAKELAKTSVDGYEKKRRENQSDEFRKAAQKAWTERYNLEKLDANRGNKNYKPTQGELKQASKRINDIMKYMKGQQEYKNGKWRDKQTENK